MSRMEKTPDSPETAILTVRGIKDKVARTDRAAAQAVREAIRVEPRGAKALPETARGREVRTEAGIPDSPAPVWATVPQT